MDNYKKTTNIFKGIETSKQVYEGGKYFKQPTGHIKTVLVKVGGLRDKNPPYQPIPKWNGTAIAREKMQRDRLIL